MAQPSPPELATAQQNHQGVLAAAMAAPLLAAWPLYVPGDPSSLARWTTAVLAIVRRFGSASAATAASYYENAREGTPGRYRATITPETPAEAVQSALTWATTETKADQATGQVDLERVQQRVEAASQKLALDAGRNTLIENIYADKECRGWARVARPGACAFCALLATRGAVYKTEQTAGFQAHDHCRCTAQPLFADAYEAPAHVRDWQALYYEVTRGKSGAAARLAFRQAIEGRLAPTT